MNKLPHQYGHKQGYENKSKFNYINAVNVSCNSATHVL